MVGAVGRAELIRALRAGGDAGLDATASLIGYERRPPSPELEFPKERQENADAGLVPAAAPASVPTPAPTSFKSIPFWRPTEAEHEDDSSGDGPPEVLEDVPKLTEDFLRPPSDARAPEPPPLVAWPRLWRILDDALRTPQPRREIDVGVLVRRWARGELLRQLPRRTGLVHARVALVVDRGTRLIPFWDDQVRLVSDLARRLGPASLRFLAPPMPGASPAVSLADDELVLAISDLGAFTGPGVGASWHRYGRDLRRAGGRLLALVPCPANRWHGPVADMWSAIDWGAPTGAPRRGDVPTEEDLEARREDLLRLVSPAVRVEPGLLREMRLLLSELDAGTEADVWAHSEVDGSSSVAMTLDSTAARQWQAEFAEWPDDVRRAAASVLLRWHRPLSKELQAEEVANLLACGLAEEWVGEERVREAAEVFRRIGATLEGNEPAAGLMAAGVFAYFRRFKNRAPEGVWQARRFRRALAQAMVALRRHDALETLPVGVTPEMIGMLAGDDQEGARRKWTVWQTGEALEVRRSDQKGAGSLLASIESRGSLTVTDGVHPAVEVGFDEELARVELLSKGSDLTLRSDLESVWVDAFRRPEWASAAGRDAHGLWASFEVEGVVQRMRWIPPGRFVMGSPEGEPGRYDREGPQHRVILTEGFWLADTPCTQALWMKVMRDRPSRFQSPRRPVELVSWNDSEEFLGWLNKRVPGLAAQLPTEAQWEYACRADTWVGTWVGGLEIRGANDAPLLDKVAWYGGNSGIDFDLENGWDSSGWPEKQYDHQDAGTHNVALKGLNPWGLYDMLGNVWEWCADWYSSSYSASTVVDPTGPGRGSDRVLRGGSWNSHARDVRAAARISHDPGSRYSFMGFRLAQGREEEAGGV